MRRNDLAAFAVAALLAWGCRTPGPVFPVPTGADCLRGVKIVLDPGHGGDGDRTDGYKRGPSGYREAVMNLEVARFLRDFLVGAGAEVRLTRDADVDLPLEERAAKANTWPADLFLSLHHNYCDDPDVNYTSAWYHGGADHEPSNVDLAWCVAEALQQEMGTQAIYGPVKSDWLMYENGFQVLASISGVTAALGEASFYSNVAEERRLMDRNYLCREAFAYYRALAAYLRKGIPSFRVAGGAGKVFRPGETVTLALDDGIGENEARYRKAWLALHPPQKPPEEAGKPPDQGQPAPEKTVLEKSPRKFYPVAWRLFPESFRFFLDGQPVSHCYDPERSAAMFALPDKLAPGSHLITGHLMNVHKNHNWPRPRTIMVGEK